MTSARKPLQRPILCQVHLLTVQSSATRAKREIVVPETNIEIRYSGRQRHRRETIKDGSSFMYYVPSRNLPVDNPHNSGKRRVITEYRFQLKRFLDPQIPFQPCRHPSKGERTMLQRAVMFASLGNQLGLILK